MGIKLEKRYVIVCDNCGRDAGSLTSATQIGAESLAKLANFVERRDGLVRNWLCPFCAATTCSETPHPGGGEAP